MRGQGVLRHGEASSELSRRQAIGLCAHEQLESIEARPLCEGGKAQNGCF